MTSRSKWLSFATSAGVLLSLLLMSFAVTANAASLKGTAHTHAAKHTAASKIPNRCPKGRIKAKGTVKFSDWQFPDTLNPYQSNAAVRLLNTLLMFDPFINYNNNAKHFPLMLTALPSVKNGGIKDGGKTLIMHFKKGMKWSNGTEITVKDWQFGFKVDSDKATGPACLAACDVIKKMDAQGKYTAILHLKHPFGPILDTLPDIWPQKWSGAWNNNPHAAAVKLEDPAFNFENDSYPTSGAYQVSEYVSQNRIVFKPNKNYNIMQCGAAVKNMIFAFYSDKNAMIAAAANRDTDVTQDYLFTDIATLQSHKSKYKIYNDPGFAVEHLELNVDPQYKGKANPLANAKVRVALALALDKLGMIRSALSLPKKAAANITAWTPLVNTKQLVQPYADKAIQGQWDPIAKKYIAPTGTGKALADAKKLLSQTPFKGGFSLDMDTTTGNPIRATEVAVATSNWKKLGVSVNPVFVPAGTFFSDWDHGSPLNHGDFQVADFAFTGGPEPDGLKYYLLSNFIDRKHTDHPGTYINYSGVQDKKLDAAWNAGANNVDPKKRRAAYKSVQEILNQKAYWIPLYYRNNIATNDGAAQNFFNNSSGEVTFNAFGWKYKAVS